MITYDNNEVNPKISSEFDKINVIPHFSLFAKNINRVQVITKRESKSLEPNKMSHELANKTF